MDEGWSVDAPVGYVFQDFSASLLPWMNLEDNITLPLRLDGLPRSLRAPRVLELLEQTSLGPLPIAKYPNQLSGGQQQRACIVRALLASSKLLILDEPFSSLDRASKLSVEKLIQDLRLRGDTLLFLIVHDLDDAVYFGDRVICLDGTPARIIEDIPVPMRWPRDHSAFLTGEFLAIRERVLRATGKL